MCRTISFFFLVLFTPVRSVRVSPRIVKNMAERRGTSVITHPPMLLTGTTEYELFAAFVSFGMTDRPLVARSFSLSPPFFSFSLSSLFFCQLYVPLLFHSSVCPVFRTLFLISTLPARSRAR